MIELKITWEDFTSEIELLHERGMGISRITSSDEELIKGFTDWRESAISFFVKVYGENHRLTREFKLLNNNKFILPNKQRQRPEKIKLKELKQDLNNDLRHLEFIKKILSVSDLVVNPLKVDLKVRKEYSSEDILDLILKKLYDLYDDNIYPILPILIGNGIELKRNREEFEYVKILENEGYVFSNNISRQADAQLTLAGKLYVEEKLKNITPDYLSIAEDEKTINSKIDELILKLEKLGYGQQIIFDEIEELRDLYSKLDNKNWGQLLKGKIIDLGLSQIINIDVMKLIYKHVTDDVLKIP